VHTARRPCTSLQLLGPLTVALAASRPWTPGGQLAGAGVFHRRRAAHDVEIGDLTIRPTRQG